MLCVQNFRACHGPTLVGRSINFWYDGPRPGPGHQILIWWATARPGPAHQIFRGWAAARLSPSHFQKFAARPGPSFFHKSRPGPSHDSAAHETRTLYGPAQQLRGPARGFDGPDHVLSRTKMCMRCLLYTSPSPRDQRGSRMPSSA